MDEDERFAHAREDPRFRSFPKEEKKVKVDERFRDALEGRGLFAGKRAKVDKRGAPVRSKRKKTTFANRYYRIQGDEEDGSFSLPPEEDVALASKDAAHVQREKKSIRERGSKRSKSAEDEESVEEEDLEYMGMRFPSFKAKQLYLRARGLEEGQLSQESSSDTESDSEPEFSDAVSESTDSGGEEVWGVGAFAGSLYGVTKHEENIPAIDQETSRLAIVDMDWDRVKAVDLYAALRSFLPKKGSLISVTVYPSDYGLQRMEEENLNGPRIFKASNKGNESEKDDSSSGEDVDNARLRSYERSRLRYYYAIAEFDSERTAAFVYKECDGMEFEKSATKFDLRFVPPEQDFSAREVKEKVSQIPSDYEAPVFETKSLQHSKPQLTWDADDEPRKKLLRRKISEENLKEEDLKAYIASTEEESDAEDATLLQAKYGTLKEVLQEGKNQHGDKDWGTVGGSTEGNMEITFDVGLENLSKKILEAKQDKQKKEGETVWETYVRRKKERAKSRKGNKRNESSDEDNSDDMYVDNPNSDHLEKFSEDEFFVDEQSRKSVKKKTPGETRKKMDLHEEKRRQGLELLMLDDNHLRDIVRGDNLQSEGKGLHSQQENVKTKAKHKKKGAKTSSGDEKDDDKMGKRENLKIDVNDARFEALYSSHHYALDPTDPRYKKDSAAVLQITEERLKRRSQKSKKSSEDVINARSDHVSAGVKAMVMSLKTKEKRQRLKKEMRQ